MAMESESEVTGYQVSYISWSDSQHNVFYLLCIKLSEAKALPVCSPSVSCQNAKLYV